jgi:hypothetical protein
MALSVAELEDVFRAGDDSRFSDQRLALAVLDAHGGSLPAEQVVREVRRLTSRARFRAEVAQRWRSDAIRVGDDETWTVNPDHPALLSARNAVRDRIEANRRRAVRFGDQGGHSAVRKRYEEKQAERAAQLAALRRVLLVAFPTDGPDAAVLVDVATRELATLSGPEVEELPKALARYDFIGALNVRGILRALGFDSARRHLAELGPPQRSYRLNRRGRTLRVTADLLAQGSCGISKPFRDPRDLRRHLDAGNDGRLRRALEADAKSLFALYCYGKIHGAYRLRWGFVDDMLPVPWVRRVETRLFVFLKEACGRGDAVEVVAGRAPAWSDPWARSVRCRVVPGRHEWDHLLVDELGRVVEQRDVQRIRVVGHA